MIRSIVWVGVICWLTTDVNASLHTLRNSGESSAKSIRMLTPSGQFELDEKPDESGFQYRAENPLTIELSDEGGPIPLELQYVAVHNNNITMRFKNSTTQKELQLSFPNTGTAIGDPVPSSFGGLANWTVAGEQSEETTLGSYSDASVTQVPEPSAWAMGAVAVALLALGRIVQRRFGSCRQ